jgi:hypothetical protein
MDTSGTNSQPAEPAQLTQQGRHLTSLKEMRDKAAAGEWLDGGAGPFEPDAMKSWGQERTVNAAVLRDLLIGDRWPVHAKGVRLRGVKISGLLDLEGATLRCPLSLDGCYLDAAGPARLNHATASQVTLTGCYLSGLTADMLTARQVDLSRSVLWGGPLSLQCADINGELICSGAELNGIDGDLNSLVAGGMTVGGSVLLDDQFTAAGAVWLARSHIAGDLECGGAQLGRNGDYVALIAEGVRVGGDVHLREGFFADGAVRLLGANITGDLSCRGARLHSDGNGNALVADRMSVGGEVHLYKGFTADGAVVLNGADITGDLCFTAAHLNGTDHDGNALAADGMKAHHDVLLDTEASGDGAFTAAGAVRLARADIAGQLSCRGAQLTGTDHDGNALVADGMKVGRDVLLDGNPEDDRMSGPPFAADGAVRLARADVAGQLSCRGAHLKGTDHHGYALVADGIRAGSAVLLDQWFTSAGTVSLRSARADQLVVSPARATGARGITFTFTAAEAQIAGELRWAPYERFSGRVDLEDANVGELNDDWTRPGGYWPDGGRLQLNGLTYGGLGDASAEQRLGWIRSQYKKSQHKNDKHKKAKHADFAAQPYEQLAAMYRQGGQDSEARAVAIARRRDLRTFGNLNWYRRFGNWFLDKTISYGYQTWRAGVGLVIVFVAFLVLSIIGQHRQVIVPVGSTTGLNPAPTATTCTSDYPCFYPFGYTVDTVIPIINVHQADSWGPDANAPAGWLWVVGAWGATAAGWALATLLVAGYTGLVRQD